MKETISLHIGGAGIRLGSSIWQLFCLEHNINPNGTLPQDLTQNRPFRTFFSQTNNQKYVPRAVHVDLEPTIIDEMKVGTYREFYNPENIICANQKAAVTFARGRQSIQIVELCLQKIRKEVEKCDDFSGFMVYNAAGGGTGSGLTSLLVQHLSTCYQKKVKINFPIYPSSNPSPIETYNSALAASNFLEQSESDISIMFQNSAIQNICQKSLQIAKPSHTDINQIISQVVSTFTAPSRFGDNYDEGFGGLSAKLIPFHRFRFMYASYSPIMNRQNSYYEDSNFYELTSNVFQPANTMVSCDPHRGKFMSCLLSFRGDIPLAAISSILSGLKMSKTVEFVDWTPCGSQLKFNRQYPMNFPNGNICRSRRSCCLISNNTAIASVFNRLAYKFDCLHANNQFIDLYQKDGIEEKQLDEVSQNLHNLTNDYAEAEIESTE